MSQVQNLARGAIRGSLMAGALALGAMPGLGAEGVSLQEVAGPPGRVRIEIDGKLFTEYCYQGSSRPYLYPILGPGDVPMTRRYPLEKSEGEEQDHVHHRSLWWAHGDVNGIDFWSESAAAGKTVHVKFLGLKSGRDTGELVSRNELIGKDGKRIATADFTIRVHRHSEVRLLDFEVVLRASDGEIELGDTKEGTMAIRLAETMRLKPNKYNAGKPTGHIVNNAGIKDGATWGKRAAWVDYYGPVQGQTLGVAIFDHPGNPKHPTWWHVRDYGLFAANPFGVHDFEQQPPGAGDMSIPAGGNLSFRYRFLFHRGDETESQVSRWFNQYAEERTVAP